MARAQGRGPDMWPCLVALLMQQALAASRGGTRFFAPTGVALEGLQLVPTNETMARVEAAAVDGAAAAAAADAAPVDGAQLSSDDMGKPQLVLPATAKPASGTTKPPPAPADTCLALQSQMKADLHHLKDISCRNMGVPSGRSEGCECRLLKTKANGGACPYDCSGSGVPACVGGAAKELGLTGLTSGQPLPVAQRSGLAYLEAFTCTYWRWSIDYDDSDKEAELRASTAGRIRFMEFMKKTGAAVEPDVTQRMRTMDKLKPDMVDFISELRGVSDGGQQAWAELR